MAPIRFKRSVVILLTIALTIVVAITATILYKDYDYRFSKAVQKDWNLKIYPKTTLSEVAAQLEEKGAIKDGEKMLLHAKKNNITSVATGNYDLERGDSYRTILETISLGKQTPIKITINNFITVERLIKAVSLRTLSKYADYIKVMYNDSFLKAKGFNKQTLISMFIPGTYEIYWTTTPQEFFEIIYGEYDNFWNNRRRSKAKDLGFTIAEITTLASIVNSETNKKDEMSDIAGVYINRLRKNMRLQADPTVKFASGQFDLRRILFKHLRIRSPYNTYRNKGLPPGPICTPSIAAIDATLDYEGHYYLYFCARTDFSGYHVFAETMREHSKNAKAYQKELNKRKIK